MRLVFENNRMTMVLHQPVTFSEGIVISGNVVIPFRFAKVSNNRSIIFLHHVSGVEPLEEVTHLYFEDGDVSIKVEVPNEMIVRIYGDAGRVSNPFPETRH